VVLALAKILRPEQLLGADDLRALASRFLGQLESFPEVFLGIRRTGVLQETEGDFAHNVDGAD